MLRFFPWVLGLILLGGATGLVVGLVQPNRYASHAKLLLRMGAREQLTSESLVEIDERGRAPAPTVVDELQMLSDSAILERVAREVGPRTILQTADPRRDDGPLTAAPIRFLHDLQAYVFHPMDELEPESAEGELRSATKALSENTTVLNEPNSSVITVSSTSTSPELARTVVQVLTSAFIERHRDQFSIQALLQQSRSQLLEATRARDESAKAYIEQVSQSGIVMLETQVPRLETDLSLLQNELFTANMRHEEIGRMRTSGHSSIDVPIHELETEDAALTARLDLLGSRLEARKARLGELQKQLLTATLSRKDLASARDAEDNRATQLQNRVSALGALVDIDGNEQANLRVLQAPSLEHEKVGPKRISLLLKGLLLGALAGIAFAILREYFERRLFYPETFELARGVPVIGVVPHLRSLRRQEPLALVGER